MKSSFFDRAVVIAAMDAATKAALSKAGAFIRRSAKSSIRKRKAVSDPGSPPSSHEGSLKRLLYFAFDKSTKSVVVGPEAFGVGIVPAALEYGGTSTTVRRRRGQKVVVTTKVRARPFMLPALEANRSVIPEQFRNSIKTGGN